MRSCCPSAKATAFSAQISDGKIDELIAHTYKGDHEKMKQAVNNVGAVVQGLQKELMRLTDASRDGQLSERGKPEQFRGAYADIVSGVNAMLDAILLPIGEGNRILAQISDGKIDELIAHTYKGDHEKMKQAVNNVGVVVQGLQKELMRLTDASKDGRLSERGKPEQFRGAYADIVRGVNAILDAVITPLNVAADYVDKISRGAIPSKISDTYNGDFNTIKNNLNNCIDNINALVADANVLAKAAVEGKLATRADADQTRRRLPQDRRRRQQHPRRRHRPVERGGQLRGSHQQGRPSAADYRHLPGRVQRHQEQPEHADRRHERCHARRRRDRPRQSDGDGSRALRARTS